MSYFDTIAPQLAAAAFNPQAYNPWAGVSILPKAETDAGARPASIGYNPGPVNMVNALGNIANASSEMPLRQAQAREAQLNAQFLNARINALPGLLKAYGIDTGAGSAPGTAPSSTGGASPLTGSPLSTQANPNGDPLDAYADRVVSLESGNTPNAKNPRSSATGAGQFLDSTWLNVAREHFPETAQMGDDALLALRNDPDFSKAMVKVYAQDNAGALSQAGIPVTAGNLYAAHFLGAGGATKVLGAAPDTQLSDLLPQNVINANPNLKGMTAGRFAANMALKMGGTGNPAGAPVQLAQNTAAPTMTDATTGPLITNGAVPGLISNRAQGTPTALAQQLVASGAGMPNAATTNPTFAAPPPATQGTPSAPVMPPGAPSPTPSASSAPGMSPGSQLDPMQLARMGAMGELFGFPNAAGPLLQAYYNSPQYLQNKAAAEKLGSYPYEVALAKAQANAQMLSKLAENGMQLGPNGVVGPEPGFNETAAATELAKAAAQRQGAPPVMRQEGTLPVWNPETKKFEIGLQVPKMPMGGMLVNGPNGPQTTVVPGVTGAIKEAAAAEEAGKAQIQPLQEQNEVLQKEYETNVVEPFNHAQDALEPLTAIQNAMQNYTTGPGAQTKLQLLKALQTGASSLGIDPGSKLGQEIASGEVIAKEGTNLGFTLARSLGSRESQMIVQQAIASNPGLANSPQGNVQLISLIKQGLQRDIDKRGFVDNWMQQHGTFAGATDAFNQTHPVETYISRAVPYQPKSEADYNALPPGVTYFNPNTNSYKVKRSNAPANQPGQ